MPSSYHLISLVAAASSAAATFQGFNYDAKLNGVAKTKDVFANEFKVAANLEGTNGGYTSARLFTTVQGGSNNQPIEAIPAAIETKTTLLLGIWCSGADNGKASVANEIEALQNATKKYCGNGLEETVIGISVGSEDLYRNSDMGKKNGPDPGLDASTLVDYIGQIRKAIKGTCLAKTSVGHVDTWNAYIDPANKPVIEAIDWIGADEYPYFEYQKPNSIEKGKELFDAAIKKIQDISDGKEIWITESGWPVKGKKSGDAVASIENAETYYREVACPLFGKMNVWWYILQDDPSGSSPDPVFGLVGSQLQTKPLYDLSCDKAPKSTKSSNSSKASKTATPSSDSGYDSGSDSGSGSGSGSGPAGSGSSNTGASIIRTGANATVAGGAQPSGGVQPDSGNRPGGAASSTDAVRAGSSQLSSLGSAALAIVLAFAML